MSTKSGRAPACEVASVVAMKVFGTVTTVSPGCTPAAIRANRKASVPLPTPTQFCTPQNCAKSRSKSSTILPPTNPAVFRALLKTDTNSSSSSRWGVTRSKKGMLPLPVIRQPQLGRDQAEDPRRIPSHDRIVRHVAGHDAAGPDDGILPDDHVREDCRPGPDRRASPHQRGLDLPVLLALEFPRRSRRPWIGVVDEGDAVADEDVILDRHAFTDEGVARNLAAPADLRILLDLDERPDLRFVADLAAVQVDELRELDVLPQLDVGRNTEVFVHRHTPPALPRPSQQAPFPEMTAAGVARRILISVQSERVLAYRRSRRTISSKVARLRPPTCQSPVIPGLASKTRRRCQGRYCSSSHGSGGRGPTSDISPRRTFHS